MRTHCGVCDVAPDRRHCETRGIPKGRPNPVENALGDRALRPFDCRHCEERTE